MMAYNATFFIEQSVLKDQQKEKVLEIRKE